MKNMLRRLQHLNGAAGIALLIGPGLLMLGLDSWISHFAGKEPSHLAQWVPVVFGPIGAVVLIAIGARRLSRRTLGIGLFAVGLLAVVVGLAGAGYHLIPFFDDLQDERLTFGTITGALSIAPPVFAPLAFAGMGALLCAVASPRVVVRVDLGKAPGSTPAEAPEPARSLGSRPRRAA
ncbi:MAG: hypothetical protein WBV82_06180 [Myxococcaceae bacterium]